METKTVQLLITCTIPDNVPLIPEEISIAFGDYPSHYVEKEVNYISDSEKPEAIFLIWTLDDIERIAEAKERKWAKDNGGLEKENHSTIYDRTLFPELLKILKSIDQEGDDVTIQTIDDLLNDCKLPEQILEQFSKMEKKERKPTIKAG